MGLSLRRGDEEARCGLDEGLPQQHGGRGLHHRALDHQLAPFGIMGLVFASVSDNGLSIFTQYGRLLLLLVGTMLLMAMVINPEQAAASEMARILRFPSAIKIETFANGHIELLQFRIGANSVLNNMRIADMGAKIHCEVLVCTVVRGDQVIIPDGNVVLQERDIVSIVAPPKMASQFFKKIKVQTDQVRDTLIIGGSTTAYYLAKQLLTMGIDVKIIDKNRERCEELSDLLPKRRSSAVRERIRMSSWKKA